MGQSWLWSIVFPLRSRALNAGIDLRGWGRPERCLCGGRVSEVDCRLFACLWRVEHVVRSQEVMMRVHTLRPRRVCARRGFFQRVNPKRSCSHSGHFPPSSTSRSWETTLWTDVLLFSHDINTYLTLNPPKTNKHHHHPGFFAFPVYRTRKHFCCFRVLPWQANRHRSFERVN